MADVTRLLDTRLVTVGTFTCPPRDAAWQSTNYIGDRLHVVFPHTSVVIRQRGREAVLGTPNHTIFYEPDQLYERELHSPRGDQCVFISVSDSAISELAEDGRITLLDRAGRLRSTHAPTRGQTYLSHHLLIRRLRSHRLGRGHAELAAIELARVALRQPLPATRARRATTAVAHRELAEAAKARLFVGLEDPLPLHALARELHTSPFHLARIFRAETGFSVDAYRRALRLRRALEKLPESKGELTSLALELGFASHSHFSYAFKREFGLAPSALRDGRPLAA
jgi:AraC-like DNA-binding protein